MRPRSRVRPEQKHSLQETACYDNVSSTNNISRYLLQKPSTVLGTPNRMTGYRREADQMNIKPSISSRSCIRSKAERPSQNKLYIHHQKYGNSANDERKSSGRNPAAYK